jgi:hypothetical protein
VSSSPQLILYVRRRWIVTTVLVWVKPPRFSGLLDSLIFGVGELLDKIDDGPPKLGVWNPHESFGEVEPVGRGEIV